MSKLIVNLPVADLPRRPLFGRSEPGKPTVLRPHRVLPGFPTIGAISTHEKFRQFTTKQPMRI
jgi:hypothetical protein